MKKHAHIKSKKKEEATQTMTENTNPTTHDMTRHVWGNGISIYTPNQDGTEATVLGHSQARIRKGDYLLLENGNSSTRYVVEKVKYKNDPSDMFEAKLRFYPRYTCPHCGTHYDPPKPNSCKVCDEKEANQQA